MSTKITFPVNGMTCAACQANVQRALQGTPGVADATVDLMTARAAVHYDPVFVTFEMLIAAVRETGYEAELPAPGRTAFDEQAAQDQAQAEEFRILRTKALVSGAIGAVAMFASMPLMDVGLGWLLLVATFGVMTWAGGHFYVRAWKSFRHHNADMNTLIAVGTGAAFLYSVIATVDPGFFLAHGVGPTSTTRR